MRTKKELINVNVKDLTQEEREGLGDLELNLCDVCGDICIDKDINWIMGIDFKDDEKAQKLVKEGKFSVCHICFDL